MATAAKSKAPKKAKAVAAPVETIEAFKAFDKDLKCRDFQYAVGQTYDHKGSVSICSAGFHACENPLDVLSYYPLTGSRFARVTIGGKIDRKDGDSKICGASIAITAELTLPDFVRAAVKGLVSLVKDKATTGNYAHSATTGNSAHSATTGYYAHSATTGDSAHSATTGNSAHSATTGNSAHSATTGYSAHSATTGYSAHSATTGNYAHSATTGNYAHSATTGNSAHSATTGNYAHSATTGNYAHSKAGGKNAIAAALGIKGTATAGNGGAITVAYYDPSTYALVNVRSSMVGQNGVEAGKTYRLNRAGDFEETTAA